MILKGDILNSQSEKDFKFLRQAIELAASSREHGNMPFGAILVDKNGKVIAEAENTTVKDPDVTGHAETNLISIASSQFSPEVLKDSTVYTSTEPCAMCSGAIYWSGVSRVVFGMSEEGLALMTGADSENPTMALPATRVLNSGQRKIEVIGPLLVDEAAVVHEGFWDPTRTD